MSDESFFSLDAIETEARRCGRWVGGKEYENS